MTLTVLHVLINLVLWAIASTSLVGSLLMVLLAMRARKKYRQYIELYGKESGTLNWWAEYGSKLPGAYSLLRQRSNSKR